jgi:hypothetical protein
MITKKAEREADRLNAAHDAGLEYFRGHPEEDMATVHRYATRVYPDKAEALEFAYGYSAGRRARDDYLREKGTQS